MAIFIILLLKPLVLLRLSRSWCECGTQGICRDATLTAEQLFFWRAVVVTCLRCDHRNVITGGAVVFQCYRTKLLLLRGDTPGLFVFLSPRQDFLGSDILLVAWGNCCWSNMLLIVEILFWLVKGLL